jgi:integrase
VGQFHKQFRLPSPRLIPIVLTPLQLKFLITDAHFHQSLSLSLKRTKDIFVFGCTVGLRYSDLMALKKQNVQYNQEGAMIKLNTLKTDTQVTIPLPDYLLDIVNKYKTKARKYVLPRLSSTNLNLQLKTLIETAGWTFALPKIRHRQGIAIELKTKKGNSYRFCDHITTHTMRRTAITTLLMMGVSETMVRRISGHAAGSKEFYKYVATVQDYLNETVKNAHQKLVNLV